MLRHECISVFGHEVPVLASILSRYNGQESSIVTMKMTSKPLNECHKIGNWGPVRTALVSQRNQACSAVQNHEGCEYEGHNASDNSINSKEEDQKSAREEENRRVHQNNNPGDKMVQSIAIDAHANEDMVECTSSHIFVKYSAFIDVLHIVSRPFLNQGGQQCAHERDQQAREPKGVCDDSRRGRGKGIRAQGG